MAIVDKSRVYIVHTHIVHTRALLEIYACPFEPSHVTPTMAYPTSGSIR